jgi:hypothetical protein
MARVEDDVAAPRLPGIRFVIGITVAVVAFAAIVAFAMYWLAPIQ